MELLFLSYSIVAWTFLEASFWWVAPDIILGIAYVHYPHQWRKFMVLGLFGALLGSWVTYVWAQHDPLHWLRYVSSMHFHSAKNISYVQAAVGNDQWSIVKGAWSGIPFKLFYGVASEKGLAFAPLAILGLISRAIRFAVVLGVTQSIRYYTKPWSVHHPRKLSLILLAIWCSMIWLVDVIINRVLF